MYFFILFVWYFRIKYYLCTIIKIVVTKLQEYEY